MNSSDSESFLAQYRAGVTAEPYTVFDQRVLERASDRKQSSRFVLFGTLAAAAVLAVVAAGTLRSVGSHSPNAESGSRDFLIQYAARERVAGMEEFR